MRNVRFLTILLLVFVIPLNAAYAAGAGLCDFFGEGSGHGAHVGHHTHDHDHAAYDGTDHEAPQPGSDHNHTHAHPLLSWMLPAPIDLHFPSAIGSRIPLMDQRFASAIPPLLERPPRFVLVA